MAGFFDRFMTGLAGGTGPLSSFAKSYNTTLDNEAYKRGVEQINSGDWQSGVNTIAERNPDVALGLAQYKQKSDDAIALQQIKNEQANQITPYQERYLKYLEGKTDTSGSGGGFGRTTAGLALSIIQNPQNYDESALKWAENYLASNSLQYATDKAFGTEQAKGNAQLGYKPQLSYETGYQAQKGKKIADIETAGNIEKEKQQAKFLSSDIDAYQNMVSKMPELEQTVDVLSNLGKKATYTKAGQLFDTAMREGLGLSTEGSIARAEYEAVVNNQILPLLRDTFGAQFTEREGESLRRTLGDVNKTPEEKDAVLRSFIEQKVKSIESLGRKIESYDKPIKQTSIKQEEQQNISEGTIVEDANGNRLILRGGQWQQI